jgi:hypothetical protein
MQFNFQIRDLILGELGMSEDTLMTKRGAQLTAMRFIPDSHILIYIEMGNKKEINGLHLK